MKSQSSWGERAGEAVCPHTSRKSSGKMGMALAESVGTRASVLVGTALSPVTCPALSRIFARILMSSVSGGALDTFYVS